MSSENITTSEEYFESLRKAPTLAGPTTLIFIAVMVGIVSVWYYALAGALPFWQGAIINGLLSYGLFSVIHDSAHRSLSSISWLNEGIGGIGLFFLFPYAPMHPVRWVHNQHHNHTNGAMDPDLYEHEAKWWQVPFKWSCFDAYYIYYFFKYGQKVLKKHFVNLVTYYTLLTVAVIVALYMGYGYEIFMLWFIPTRISLFLIAVVFVILPHHPATVTQVENKYMATTMRMGWEWLLTPLMVYQNYHLIHHLWPEIPFYKMHKAWFLKYDELNAENLSRQTAFGLVPANIETHKNFDRSQSV